MLPPRTWPCCPGGPRAAGLGVCGLQQSPPQVRLRPSWEPWGLTSCPAPGASETLAGHLFPSLWAGADPEGPCRSELVCSLVSCGLQAS